MLLQQLGLADVAGENVGALVPRYSFIFQTLAPFLAAVAIQPERIE